MQCPLYKKLKENGTSFYAFPGAAEDISAAYQNDNYKMYFTKYILLDFPAQNLVNPGFTQSENIYWNFASFSSLNVVQPESFGDKVIESLRNYVANHEVTVRESRLNNTDYYYDHTALETTTEKIFFKWCKHLGLIGFDRALEKDEFNNTLQEFERESETDDSYFPEYLWKERSTESFGINNFDVFDGNLSLTINGVSNFRAGDIIEIDGISNTTIAGEFYGGTEWLGPVRVTVLSVTVDGNDNHVVTIDFPSGINEETDGLENSSVKLFYHRLVQYIGEINGISNVQEANKAYTEVFAHVPAHTGQTPDILFRTKTDLNYRVGMQFPIIPNQFQPEIIGAELFSSPIVSNPQNYPGGYYGDFDTEDFTYITQNGDPLRRSGAYFGVSGNFNAPIFNASTIDGISVDFNTEHYIKMNLDSQLITNFDTFNALDVNSDPPIDFEFNAILWYYEVEDTTGSRAQNLYGISFLDNPENNPKDEELGIRFPTYRKLVSNGNQDGTSYQFALNLNFNIINDNPVEAFNPEAINSLFSMSLFNNAMERLAKINDSFSNILEEHSNLKTELSTIKQLLYTQTDLNVIKSRIDGLDRLLRLYSTLQLRTSDSIRVRTITLTEFATVELEMIEPAYSKIYQAFTSQMYQNNQVVPYQLVIDTQRDILLRVINDDEVVSVLENDNNLKVLINSDLDYRQTLEVDISATDTSLTNKKLDIVMVSESSTSRPLDEVVTTPVETILIGDIDLPIFFNSRTSNLNSARNLTGFDFKIDFNKSIVVGAGNLMQLTLDSNPYIVNNSIKAGDCLYLNNFLVGTSSVFDFSGQYFVSSVGATNSQISVDISENKEFVNFVTVSIPYTIHTSSSTQLSNQPFFSLNKGKNIKITRVIEGAASVLKKYRIEVRNY